MNKIYYQKMNFTSYMAGILSIVGLVISLFSSTIGAILLILVVLISNGFINEDYFINKNNNLYLVKGNISWIFRIFSFIFLFVSIGICLLGEYDLSIILIYLILIFIFVLNIIKSFKITKFINNLDNIDIFMNKEFDSYLLEEIDFDKGIYRLSLKSISRKNQYYDEIKLSKFYNDYKELKLILKNKKCKKEGN